MKEMAAIRISEAEAARDFAAVMRHVRAGDEVLLEEDGGRVVGVMRAPDAANAESGDVNAELPGRTVEETIERLRNWESQHGPLRMDADFAADVDKAHESLNQQLDRSAWD